MQPWRTDLRTVRTVKKSNATIVKRLEDCSQNIIISCNHWRKDLMTVHTVKNIISCSHGGNT